jgi:uncharacterized protein YcgI (DUF1989 family)
VPIGDVDLAAALALRAEIDLIVGLTACSAEMSNNYALKPIGYEIIGAAR